MIITTSYAITGTKNLSPLLFKKYKYSMQLYELFNMSYIRD